jgi:hypothetical protein
VRLPEVPWLYRLGVVFGVVLAGFFGVVNGMVEMPLSDVGVMPGLLMIAPFMVLGCGQVVLRCVFMMFCRLSMMLYGFLGHEISSFKERLRSADCSGSMNPELILTAGCDGSITSR